MMGKTKTPANTPHAGIRHSTTSARAHRASARASDWLWFAVALAAVVAIYLL